MAFAPGSGGDESPVFVLGAPRSGTSLLFSCLSLHPDAAWISNWVRRFPQAPALALLNRIPGRFPDRRHELWFGRDGDNAYVFDNARSVISKLFPVPAEGEPLFSRAGVGDTSDTAERGVATKLAKELTAVRRFSGGRVLVNKRIANNRRVALLRAAFPSARFVHLVRDGRAVASSLRQVGWWPDERMWWLDGSTVATLEAAGHDGWDLAARHWVEELGAIEAGLSHVATDRQLEQRYEDLVADPVATLTRIAEFAGLGRDASWSRAVGRVQFPNRSEGWRRRLDDETVARIEAHQRPQLEQHGYLP